MTKFVLARVSTPESQGDGCPILTEERVSPLDSFKFDSSQSMKFLPDLGDPSSLRPKVSTMKSICGKANQSEKFYRRFSKDQWLRSAIVDIPRDPDTRVDISRSPAHAIHSNVLPSKAYLTGWEFTCAQMVYNPVSPADNFKGFFPIELLEKCLRGPSRTMGVEEGSVDDGDRGSTKPSSTECSELLDSDLLKQELLEWIMEGEKHQQQQHQCHLASELQRCQNATNDYMPSTDREFWFVHASEVEPMRYVGSGAAGEVRQVLWNGGMFARKEFANETALNKEASIAFQVSHPHVVHYFGRSDPEDGSRKYHLFMELLDTDLFNFIDLSTKTEKLPLFPTDKDMLEVLLQIAQAMEHLHKKNVVHGDLKPRNILLSRFELINPNEEYCLVKVADLGSAQEVESFICPGGTTEYAAPEVLMGRKDEQLIIEQPLKIDVFSFGIVVYQVQTRLLSMEEMYKCESRSECIQRVKDGIIPDLEKLPPSLRGLVKGCLFQKPAERLTFAQICRTLQVLIDAEAQKDRSTSIFSRYFKLFGRRA